MKTQVVTQEIMDAALEAYASEPDWKTGLLAAVEAALEIDRKKMALTVEDEAAQGGWPDSVRPAFRRTAAIIRNGGIR